MQADDAVILLLEMQPEIVRASRTNPEADLRRALSALLEGAAALGIPVAASAVPLAPGVPPSLVEELDGHPPVVRTAVAALDDEAVLGRVADGGASCWRSAASPPR